MSTEPVPAARAMGLGASSKTDGAVAVAFVLYGCISVAEGLESCESFQAPRGSKFMAHAKRWNGLAGGLGIALGFLSGANPGEAAEPVRPGVEAEAPMWWVGFQLHGITDGSAPEYTRDTLTAYRTPRGTHFGWGAGLSIPVSVNLYRGLGFRTALSLSYSGDPFDRVESQITFLERSEEGGYERAYLTRGGYFGSAAIQFDVLYTFPLLFGTFKPYLGVGPGLYLNYVFTNLTEAEFYLLDNQYNDPQDPDNIDPYSVNLEPGFNGFVGVNFKVTGAMHLNFELEYNRAQMDEAPLLKATDGSDARRAAYVYSVVKLSSGILFNF